MRVTLRFDGSRIVGWGHYGHAELPTDSESGAAVQDRNRSRSEYGLFSLLLTFQQSVNDVAQDEFRATLRQHHEFLVVRRDVPIADHRFRFPHAKNADIVHAINACALKLAESQFSIAVLFLQPTHNLIYGQRWLLESPSTAQLCSEIRLVARSTTPARCMSVQEGTLIDRKQEFVEPVPSPQPPLAEPWVDHSGFLRPTRHGAAGSRETRPSGVREQQLQIA